MDIKYGKGTTEFGPGVMVELTSVEVDTAIDAYLVNQEVYVSGPRSIQLEDGGAEVYVDPSGSVRYAGIETFGRGPTDKPSPSCDICGGEKAYIRGKHPDEDKRLVCPTCMAETLDDVKDRMGDNYNRACEVES